MLFILLFIYTQLLNCLTDALTQAQHVEETKQRRSRLFSKPQLPVMYIDLYKLPFSHILSINDSYSIESLFINGPSIDQQLFSSVISPSLLALILIRPLMIFTPHLHSSAFNLAYKKLM